MLVSKLELFFLSLIFVVICAFIISTITKRSVTYLCGIGCVPGMFLTFVFWILLMFIMPRVVIITGSGKNLEDEESFALFKYEGHPLNFCGKYLDNQSTERLIIYPQLYYSSKVQDPKFEINDGDITIIEPNSFIVINNVPDYFFYVPSSIRSKKKGGTQIEWILERYSPIEEEYIKKQKLQREILDNFFNDKK